MQILDFLRTKINKKGIPESGTPTINKILITTGHLSFLVLLSLSIFYSRERVVFIDTVFQFFKIVNFERFNIEAERYSTLLTQIPLLLAIKANLSLKSLILIYSVSFILEYYLIFIICTHMFKNVSAGIILVFVFLLCIRQSFFHSSTETHQGLVYTAFLIAVLYHAPGEKRSLFRYLLISVAVILCFYSHPVTLFTVLFVIGYYIIDKSGWKDPGAYLGVFLIVILSLIKLVTTRESSYEGNFFGEIRNASTYVSNFGDLYSTNFFQDRMWGLYFWPWLFFVIALLGILWRKQYLKFSFVLLSTAVFLVLTLITYNKGDSNVMMERAFMPLVIFIMLPYLNDVVLRTSAIMRPIMIGILIFALFAGIRRISMEGVRFRAGYQYVVSLIERTSYCEGKKFLLDKSHESETRFLFWTAPFTSMVVSSIQGPENTKTIFLYDDFHEYEKYLSSGTDIFLGTTFWLEWDIGSLNSRYFILHDEPYRLLE